MAENLSKLKKRSDASYKLRRDRPLIVFVDRSLGKKQVPAGIAKIPGVVSKAHDNHFSQTAKDTQWLPVVAKRQWIILTKDKMIQKRQLELDAVMKNDAYLITFGRGDYTAAEMVKSFDLAFEKIRNAVALYKPPLIARITKTGNFKIL